jgi:hypothetical protein
MTTKANKSAPKSPKSAIRTAADGLCAVTLGAFTDAVKAAETAGQSAVRVLSVALFAASIRKDVKDFKSAAGNGAYAWYVTVASGVASKGRHSQYVTFGRWIDAAERAGRPELVATEYDARALQSAASEAKAKDPAAFLSGYDRAGIDALVADRVTAGKSGGKSGKGDGETPSGKKVALTCEGLADAVGDMVAAAVSRPDATTETIAALRAALIAAAALCETPKGGKASK